MAVRFDPMTGEPITDHEGAKYEQGMRFDPMTGEPITDKRDAKQERTVRFDPMTGRPIREKKRVPIGVKVVCGIAAGAAIAAAAAVSLFPRIVFGKNYKIVQAASNTFKENHLTENFNALPVLESGKYTVTVNIDTDKLETVLTLASNLSKKEFTLAGAVSAGVVNTDFVAKVNDSEVLLSAPDFVDETLRYSYKEEKSSYFEKLVEDTLNTDVEEIDETMKNLFSEKRDESLSESVAKASIQVIKTLDFEKADKRKFTVDGKNRSCNGYTLKVDEDLVSDVCDIYEDAVDEYMQGLDEVSSIAGAGTLDSKRMFDEIRDSFEDVEYELSVYLYKKQIAAIEIEGEGEEFLIEFCGGSTPWESTIVSVEGKEVLKLTGSVQKDVEDMSLEVEGIEVAEYSYNFKDGDFELKLGEGDYTFAKLRGNILHSGKEYTYKVSDIPMGDLGEGFVQVQIKEGAEMPEIKTKETLDIGTMSESDWEEFAKDIMGIFYEWLW